MIGLCFLFATIWKIRSPDFLSGDFFSWKFTTDIRFREMAESLLGTPREANAENFQTLASLKAGPIGRVADFVIGDRTYTVARFVSWYTVLIEGIVAVTYLAPQRSRISKLSHWALFVFIVTVYPIAPVIGFALILLALSVGAVSEQFSLRRDDPPRAPSRVVEQSLRRDGVRNQLPQEQHRY